MSTGRDPFKHCLFSTPAHAFSLAPRLRDEDVAEVEAVGASPLVSLLAGVSRSAPCLTFAPDGVTPECMFGVAPSYNFWSRGGNSGVVWLLGSKALVTTYKREFVTAGRKWADLANRKYPILYNVVDARNEVHIHWLERIGCTFVELYLEYGPQKRPFILFMRKGDTHVRTSNTRSDSNRCRCRCRGSASASPK